MLHFVVDEYGSIQDITVARSLSASTDSVAVETLKSMPAWKPGKLHGVPVKVYYMLPISFRLLNDTDITKPYPGLT